MGESSSTFRVLIADDEPLARQGMLDILSSGSKVEVVGQAKDGKEATELINELKPDIVFLDIEMPGLNGLEVVKEVGVEKMPMVIFATAFDQYAVEAFELAAIDYVLKPFDKDRVEAALQRAGDAIRKNDVEKIADRLEMLIDSSAGNDSKYIERVAVESRGKERILSMDSIDYITASGPYAELHVGEQVFLLRVRMQTLEDKLDPSKFFRIHRSSIVSLDQIDTLVNGSGGDYSIQLKSGVRLNLGRGRRDDLRTRLGLNTL